MSRVAKVAQVTKSNLYNYFRDKDELLRFVHVRLVEPLMETIEEAARAEVAAPRRLERILLAAFEYTVKHKGLIRLLRETSQESAAKKDVCPRALEIFTTIFERGIEEGSFRQHNPAYTGHMFLGCLMQLFEIQAGGASTEAVSEYVNVLIDAVLNGFSIHTEPAGKANDAIPHLSNP